MRPSAAADNHQVPVRGPQREALGIQWGGVGPRCGLRLFPAPSYRLAGHLDLRTVREREAQS